MEAIENYFQKVSHWEKELRLLRSWLQETELVETVKWGAPTYTINGKNVVGFSGFKNHFGLWFFQGVFLKDEKGLLINAQEGKTKGLRQMRFTAMKQLERSTILAYVEEAIENQKANKEIKVERTKSVNVPPELANALANNKSLSKDFDALSLGKRKEYAEYIASAKQEKTKLSRLEKITPMIQNGVGLNDKYKNC